MILLEFCFDEGNASDKMDQDVLFFGVVDFDLLVGEALLNGKNWGPSVFAGDTDGLNGHTPSHRREDAVDVVFLESFHICDAGDVAEPEVWDHLVHGGARESWFTGVGRDPAGSRSLKY